MFEVETESREREFSQLQPFTSYTFYVKRKGDPSFAASVNRRTMGLGKKDKSGITAFRGKLKKAESILLFPNDINFWEIGCLFFQSSIGQNQIFSS